MSMLRTPRCASASTTALTTAWGAAVAPDSWYLTRQLASLRALPVLPMVASLVVLGVQAGGLFLVGPCDYLGRSWDDQLARAIAQAERTHETLSVALCDVNGLKEINDRQGHAAGDALLRSIAERWLAVPFAELLGVEHASSVKMPEGGETRRYGTTSITFYRRGS